MEQNTNIEQNDNDGSNLEKYILPGAIIMAGVLISAAVIYSNGGLSGTARVGDAVGELKAVSTDDDAYLGDKDAPVVIVEFSDYQCPFCRSFWRDTLPLIKSEYIDTGKVRFVYRDFPLDMHPGAMPAAQATECAEEQGKFWEMHDKIFIEQEKQGGGTVQFGVDDIKKWAGGIGLNISELSSCLDSQKYAEEVKKDLKDGQTAGVSGTPGFFVNGRLVVGAQPFSVFKTIIDEELAK